MIFDPPPPTALSRRCVVGSRQRPIPLAPPPEPLGLGRLVPLAPPVPLLRLPLLLGLQSAELLLVLPGMQLSLPAPLPLLPELPGLLLDPLPEPPPIPELLLPPPLVLGLVGLLLPPLD